MKKETLLLVGVAFVAGVLVGIIGSNRVSNRTETGPAAAVNPVAPVVNQQQEVATLQGIVAAEPDNRNAWVQLGHRFFDSDQPMAAIDAYARALELDGDDPDVLTDQGIMFRQVGWYDRAIANFEKAAGPKRDHLQSLYNLGIVYRYDLQDFAKAISAWSRFVELNPSGSAAEQIRAELEFMRLHLNLSQVPEVPAQSE